MTKKNEQTHREEKLKKYKALIADLRLIDDVFLMRCFDGNIICTELVLRIILNMPSLKVISVAVQKTIHNLLSHSVRLDVYDMHYKELADCVRVYKETEKGDDVMSILFDQFVEEAEKRGEKRGENKLGRLMSILLWKGKEKEAQDAAVDATRRNELYIEYGIC